MKFKYKKIPDATQVKGYASLPYIRVRLFNGNKTFDVYGLIDTGADDCMFHSSVAYGLGINLVSGRPKQYAGIGGQIVDTYLHPIQLQIHGFSERVDIEAAFSDENQLSLLGENGFFDNYQVIFERYRGRFEVKGRTRPFAR